MADDPAKPPVKSDTEVWAALQKLIDKQVPEAVKTAMAKQVADAKAAADGAVLPKTPLTPEEKIEVDKLMKQTEAEDALIQTVKDIGKGITPETNEWLKGLTAERDRQTAAATLEAAKTTLAGVAGAVGGQALSGNVVPLTSDAVHRSITSLDRDTKMNFEPLAPDWLRQHGLDPNAIPVEVAPALQALLKAHNQVKRDLKFVVGEGKTAMESRDKVKKQLFSTELIGHLQQEGYEIDDSVKDMTDIVRTMAFDNGNRLPWPALLERVTDKYPAVFRKTDGTPATPPAAATPAVTPDPAATTPPVTPPTGATPTVPLGTRNVSPAAGAGNVTLPPAKTMEEAGARFTADLNSGKIKLKG